jgi:hypothetical protein
MLTRISYWTLSWARWLYLTLSRHVYFFKQNFYNVFPSKYRSQSNSGFPAKILEAFMIFHGQYTNPHRPSSLTPSKYLAKSVSEALSPPASCYIFPLRSKYSSPSPVLRFSQSTFLPFGDRPRSNIKREVLGRANRLLLSQNQSFFTTGVLPPISSSWRQAPWDSRTEISFFFFNLNFAVIVLMLHPLWREDRFASYENAWPFVNCAYRTYSMLLKILSFALYTSPLSV